MILREGGKMEVGWHPIPWVGRKNSDLTQNTSHSVWDSHSLAPVFPCHSLHLSPEFMFFNLHPLTRLVPFSKNRFLGSPTKCVCLRVVSGLAARAWPGNLLEKHTFEPHPEHTVSQTLERVPGICGSLSPKGEKKITVSATAKDQSNGVRSQLTM